jgi:hypothetical protein
MRPSLFGCEKSISRIGMLQSTARVPRLSHKITFALNDKSTRGGHEVEEVMFEGLESQNHIKCRQNQSWIRN